MAPEERLTFSTQYEARTSRVRVAKLAGRQFGRVTRAQLKALSVPRSTIDRWLATGYLFRVLPRVYAIGHAAQDERSQLFSLVLLAGPDAGLSHGTSAHWRGWLRYPVDALHVSTPRRIRTRVPGVVFHGNRNIERELVNGIPCTTTTQTLLDLAATESQKLVQRSLAQLEYARTLDARTIRAACGRGRPGSAALLTALETYMPQLARTKSELEDEFLYLCERARLPLPAVNTSVHGIEVDAYWADLKLAVELDGQGNHATSAQRTRDQRRGLRLRARGIDLVRYTWEQVYRHPNETIRDLAFKAERVDPNMLN